MRRRGSGWPLRPSGGPWLLSASAELRAHDGPIASPRPIPLAVASPAGVDYANCRERNVHHDPGEATLAPCPQRSARGPGRGVTEHPPAIKLPIRPPIG